MKKLTDEELIQGIDEMITDALGVGLCTFGFKILRDGVTDLIAEKNHLRDLLNPPKPDFQSGRAEMPDVLMFIGRFSSNGHVVRKEVEDCFLFGCCWWFAYILKTRFEREYPCEIVVDYARNHFACRINGSVYDISGLRPDMLGWEPWDACADDALKDRITAECILF